MRYVLPTNHCGPCLRVLLLLLSVRSGLYELHRLPRDVAKEWFAARRAADGISSSTQKRTGRASLREKDRDIEVGVRCPGKGARRLAVSNLLMRAAL